MVSAGARHLVLASRGRPSEHTVAEVAGLEQRGARATGERVDRLQAGAAQREGDAWLCLERVYRQCAWIAAVAPETGEAALAEMRAAGAARAPWVAFLVVPLFGFANAGVDLDGIGLAQVMAPLPLGIAAGLFLGKQIGIFGAVRLAVRFGLASPLRGATWLQVYGVATLCGIGFTMSLFIGSLAFTGDPARAAGMDVVVTDHHTPRADGALPDAPIVHPRLGGYPCPDLCAAAVAHKLAQALLQAHGEDPSRPGDCEGESATPTTDMPSGGNGSAVAAEHKENQRRCAVTLLPRFCKQAF